MSQAHFKEPVYILIPVYNRKETTLACLDNLKKSGDLQRYHVVIVDDGSTDGTAEAVNALYPDVAVLPGNGDLWWTGAMAKAMHYASQQGAKYFIWLNDDCFPEPDALSQLIAFMQAHPDTIVGPSCYVRMSSSLSISTHNAFKGRKGCAARPGEVIYVDGLSGWCVGIPASVFRKIGPPDTYKFPHYSGDDTYILRATRAGFKACVVGDLKVNLFGPVHPKLDFHSYFRPGLTPVATFKALFWSKKSPYRLPTAFFYQTERYGPFLGLSFFTLKLILWLGKWAKLQLMLGLRPKTIEVGDSL
ncbi:MAG: glycosyltransferase family 2 protein [Hydrococcus sp. C42_A2020_068]|nr:glycosyltransferase family 2 protein [Hydrococcus sp. C42_A2020_068]